MADRTEVKNDVYQMLLDNLHITYEPDGSTKRRIMNEAASGIAYIRKYCNPDADCIPGTLEGQLLCEYVLRAEAGALDTFSKDFAGEITACSIEYEAAKYAEAMGYAEI